MTRWEYLRLSWEARQDGSAGWTRKVSITRPDGRPEMILEPDGAADVPWSPRWDPMPVLIDLGAQGWELVSIQTVHGAGGEHAVGMNYRAVPVGAEYFFKRPAEG
jgi:hypothetical protein